MGACYCVGGAVCAAGAAVVGAVRGMAGRVAAAMA